MICWLFGHHFIERGGDVRMWGEPHVYCRRCFSTRRFIAHDLTVGTASSGTSATITSGVTR